MSNFRSSISYGVPASGGPQSQNYTQILIQAQEQKHLASRLINLKPSVDNREPKKYTHLMQKQKNFQDISRQKQIDQENSFLLKKMLDIIQRKNQSFRDSEQSLQLNPVQNALQKHQNLMNQTSSFQQSSQLGIITERSHKNEGETNKNNHEGGEKVNNLQNYGTSNDISIYQQAYAQNNFNIPTQVSVNGSLNFYQRKKEINQINNSNRLLLKQLQEVKPSIKRIDWQQHIKKYEKLKNHLSSNKMKQSSPTNSNNQSVLLPLLNNSRQTKTGAQLDRSSLFSQQTQRNFFRNNKDLSQSMINNQQFVDNSLDNQQLLINIQQDYSTVRTDTQNHTTNQSSTQVKLMGNKTLYNSKFVGIQEGLNAINKSSDQGQRIFKKTNRTKGHANPYLDDSLINQDQINEARKVSTSQNKTRADQEEKQLRQSMTKSVPRPRGYYENIMKSPLLNFANYPQSIVRRISSRANANRDKILRKGLQVSNQAINQNQLNSKENLNTQTNSNQLSQSYILQENTENRNFTQFTANNQSASSLIIREVQNHQSSNQDLQLIYNSVQFQPSQEYFNNNPTTQSQLVNYPSDEQNPISIQTQSQREANQTPQGQLQTNDNQNSQAIIKQISHLSFTELGRDTEEINTHIQSQKNLALDDQQVSQIDQNKLDKNYHQLEEEEILVKSVQPNSTIEENILSNPSAINTPQI